MVFGSGHTYLPYPYAMHFLLEARMIPLLLFYSRRSTFSNNPIISPGATLNSGSGPKWTWPRLSSTSLSHFTFFLGRAVIYIIVYLFILS